MTWIVTGFSIASFFWQARKIDEKPCNETLSLVDLAAQTLVFTLVGVSWVMGAKYSLPRDGYGGV
jgi:hypothetical protein